MEISSKVMSQAAYKNWDLSRLETLLTKVHNNLRDRASQLGPNFLPVPIYRGAARDFPQILEIEKARASREDLEQV